MPMYSSLVYNGAMHTARAVEMVTPAMLAICLLMMVADCSAEVINCLMLSTL